MGYFNTGITFSGQEPTEEPLLMPKMNFGEVTTEPKVCDDNEPYLMPVMNFGEKKEQKNSNDKKSHIEEKGETPLLMPVMSFDKK